MRLGDIIKTNANTYSARDKWSFVNYLDTGNIASNFINNIQYIDLETDKLPSRARRKVQINSIIYSTVRPNQNHYGIIKSFPNNFLISTGFTVIDVDSSKANADYIYFWLTQKSITDKLQAIAEQSVSTYPSIKPSDIEELEIELPPLSTQEKIANLLLSLTKKIENNMELNDNLEQQAISIYNELIINNQEDNRIGHLCDIAKIEMGQSPSGLSYNEVGTGEVFYQGRTDFGNRFPSRRLFTTEPKKMAEEGDILLSVRAPVGDLNIATEKCCIGRGLASIRSKNKMSSFLLYTMLNAKKQLDVFNNEGTVFGSVNKDALNNLEITIPSQETISKFEELVSPIDHYIWNNDMESIRLKEMRDSLLPKLLTGEIEI